MYKPRTYRGLIRLALCVECDLGYRHLVNWTPLSHLVMVSAWSVLGLELSLQSTAPGPSKPEAAGGLGVVERYPVAVDSDCKRWRSIVCRGSVSVKRHGTGGTEASVKMICDEENKWFEKAQGVYADKSKTQKGKGEERRSKVEEEKYKRVIELGLTLAWSSGIMRMLRVVKV